MRVTALDSGKSSEAPGLVQSSSRFGIVNNRTPYDVTIRTYDRPSLLVFQGSGKPDVTITYALTPTSDGTELASELDFRPNSIAARCEGQPACRRLSRERKRFGSSQWHALV